MNFILKFSTSILTEKLQSHFFTGAGVDLHMAQLMPVPLTVFCFQTGFTFLVPAHPGIPGQRAVKRVCVCVCVC